MVVIAQTNMRVGVPTTITPTASTTGGGETLVYNPGTYQMLEIRNTTGSSVNCVIDGSGVTTITQMVTVVLLTYQQVRLFL